MGVLGTWYLTSDSAHQHVYCEIVVVVVAVVVHVTLTFMLGRLQGHASKKAKAARRKNMQDAEKTAEKENWEPWIG